MPFPALSKAINIFFSYASTVSTDRDYFDKLMTHVSVLQHLQLIDKCYDSAISPEENIFQLIETYLDKVDIIVLLISADFIASQRCYKLEMKRALERAETEAVQVIPVILRPTYWKNLPFSKYSPLPPGGNPISSWKDIDDALSQVVQGIHQVIQKITNQTQRRDPTPSQSRLLSIPYRRNSFFTDRESIFETLSLSFRPKEGAMLALSGLDGIGKTQIALEYSYRSLQHYRTILWLNAPSREILSAEVGLLSDRLALSGRERMNEQQIFEAVKRWLENQSEWLLVLDALHDLSLVNLLVPTQNNGHVLLTTHTQTSGGLASIVSIVQMGDKASLLFFLQRANLLPLQAPISQAPAEVVILAEKLVREMDGFPLALDQAAAYLEETGCDLATYLNLYHDERTAILGERGQSMDQSHPDSVLITLTLAFEQVIKKRPVNQDLLYLLAFLQPDSIPEQLFIEGARKLDEPLQSLATHSLTLHQALGDLLRFSLIQRSSNSMLLRIHRIVQFVLTDQLSAEQQRQWANIVVGMLNSVFPSGYFDTWSDCERYLPQAQHCATLIEQYQLTSQDATQLLQRLGSYCYRRGYYHEAKLYLTQSLRLYEEQSDGDAANVAQVLNSLGLLAHRQALYLEAETHHQRALELRELTLGPEHPKIAESLHNLALPYGKLEKYQQAEALYLRVLSLDEHTHGIDHPETARTLNNLGLVYYKQGKYSQAEEAYQRSLTIYEKALPNHPDLTYPVIGLGSIEEKRGNYTQAEIHYLRALTIREEKLGDQHPETAHSLNKLADIYEIQGNDEQAEILYQRALAIAEQILGPEHPDVALFLNNLAFLASKHEQYPKAEPLYQRALRIYEQSLGPEHREVASVLNNLGRLYQKTGDLERAEKLLRCALSIRQQVLGVDHPDTVRSVKNLADLLNT
jgi:tetratricopeptide (TPR) repeat protein